MAEILVKTILALPYTHIFEEIVNHFIESNGEITLDADENSVRYSPHEFYSHILVSPSATMIRLFLEQNSIIYSSDDVKGITGKLLSKFIPKYAILTKIFPREIVNIIGCYYFPFSDIEAHISLSYLERSNYYGCDFVAGDSRIRKWIENLFFWGFLLSDRRIEDALYAVYAYDKTSHCIGFFPSNPKHAGLKVTERNRNEQFNICSGLQNAVQKYLVWSINNLPELIDPQEPQYHVLFLKKLSFLASRVRIIRFKYLVKRGSKPSHGQIAYYQGIYFINAFSPSGGNVLTTATIEQRVRLLGHKWLLPYLRDCGYTNVTYREGRHCINPIPYKKKDGSVIHWTDPIDLYEKVKNEK